MRIVHFSDIHVACPPRSLAACFDKRLLGTLNFYLRRRMQFRADLLERGLAHVRALAPDWVVCTGDLTSIGTPQEFDRVGERLRPLLQAYPGRVLFVPGNHDNYVRSRVCRQHLEAAFRRVNGERCGLNDLPCVINDGEVRFFLVDESCPVDWVRSSGRLSPTAALRLEAWLSAPRRPREKRLVVGHFPLRDGAGRRLAWRRRLNRAAVLERALQQGWADVFLCGHNHEPFLRQEPNGVLEICAGALPICGRLSVLDYAPASGRFSHFWVDVAGVGSTGAVAGALAPAVATQ